MASSRRRAPRRLDLIYQYPNKPDLPLGAIPGLLVGQPVPVRHDEHFTATSTFRAEHDFGVSPATVLLYDSRGREVVVAWKDDGVGHIVDLYFNGTLTNARVLLEAHITEEDMAASDYYMEVSRGNVAGHTAFALHGVNPDIDAGGGEQIWNKGGAWAALASGAQLIDVVSDNTDDDGAPVGTGARTVVVYGLDSDYALASETVIMDGTTPVTTVGSYLMVYLLQVGTTGSQNRNLGTITATGDTDTGTTVAQIDPSNNESASCIFQVPASTTYYITRFEGSIGKDSVSSTSVELDLAIYVQEFGSAARRKFPAGSSAISTARIVHEFNPPLVVPAQAIVWLWGEASAADTEVYGSFQGILVAD